MELLVVFTGVLIALSAQAWAEERSAKARAEAAEARARNELGLNVYQLVERIVLQNCLKQRLVALMTGLSDGRTDWTNMRMEEPDNREVWAFASVYRVPARSWVSSEYRGSMASGALDAVAPDRAAELASSYELVEFARAINAEEQLLATRLAAIQFGPPLSGPQRNDLISTLTRLDYLNGMMNLIARQTVARSNRLYPFKSQELIEVRAEWPAYIAERRLIYGACVNSRAADVLDPRILAR